MYPALPFYYEYLMLFHYRHCVFIPQQFHPPNTDVIIFLSLFFGHPQHGEDQLALAARIFLSVSNPNSDLLRKRTFHGCQCQDEEERAKQEHCEGKCFFNPNPVTIKLINFLFIC
uniref:Uncharacterized protein n=1 Tax=Trypanosoma congolense (strain IL3000) TaxID=1068625 RepID=G0UT01_TRYCI|nr:hypothetical protein, unlikely [Trypanosoma congolense IL3000]